MKYGPLVFLAAFFAIAGSWLGFVFTPQLQLGRLQQTNAVPSGSAYPVARPGLAQQGREVYRANGCATCHSQQVGQTGTVFDVTLSDAGTNRAATLAAMLKVNPALSEAEATRSLGALPKAVLEGATKETAESAVKALAVGGGKAQIVIRPIGPDITRRWGKRRSVAQDFLFDSPVMLGSQRVGPDLANVGVRFPDANWHLRHLYAPRSEVKGSTMPTYRFLFEKRRIEQAPSPEALALPSAFGPGTGYEIVPTAEARALVAYLQSLRADVPLFTAPFALAAAPASQTISTNTDSTK
jgi:cbb3-type cytochrome oxidase cytochrome c subunit